VVNLQSLNVATSDGLALTLNRILIIFVAQPCNEKEGTQKMIMVIITNLRSIFYNHSLHFEAILSNFSNSLPELKKIVLKTADRIYLINTKDIIRCESENNYTIFHLANKNKVMVSKTIKTYEEMLSGKDFMRVHQSHLVNLNYIEYFDKPEGGILVLSNNSTISVSHNKKPVLLKFFFHVIQLQILFHYFRILNFVI